MADALSKNVSSICSLATIRVDKQPLDRNVQILVNRLVRYHLSDEGGVLAFLEV